MADGGDGTGHGGEGRGHDHGDGHICHCAQEHKDSLETVDERCSLLPVTERKKATDCICKKTTSCLHHAGAFCM